jgi:parallel beta-helix repeat protein
LQGCGGGGGGGGSGGIGGPDPIATIERPQEEVTVPAGGNINDAIRIHPQGVSIILEGGVYDPVAMEPGVVSGPIFIEAGENEEGEPTIIGQGHDAAILLDSQTNVVIDGLRIVGGNVAGVYAIDSDNIDIRNCTISRARTGVVMERVSTSLVFDNLICGNSVAGIMGLGSSDLRLINNTVYGHPNRGIFIGSSPGDGAAITGSETFVQNNIIDSNVPVGIGVENGSEDGYFATYNINTDGYEGVPPGFFDLNANPLFIFPSACPPTFDERDLKGFLVQIASGGGSSPAIDRGDPDTDPVLVAVLRERTIRNDNFADGGVPDLGFHYPEGQDTPTPFPTTPTPGPPGSTPTRTFTRTPTRTPTFTPTPTT